MSLLPGFLQCRCRQSGGGRASRHTRDRDGVSHLSVRTFLAEIRQICGFVISCPRRNVSTGPFRHRCERAKKTKAEKDAETLAYTVIWYGKQGIVEKASFETEKAARDNALANFSARNSDGIVAVEVRKDDGSVVFSQAGSN